MNRSTSHNSHGRHHSYRAGEFLARADRSRLAQLIACHVRPEDYEQAMERSLDDIKVVVQFSEI